MNIPTHKILSYPLSLVLLLAFLTGCADKNQIAKQDYPIQPIPFHKVELSDDFWAPRIEINRVITIPFALKQNEDTGRVDNFAIAGGLKPGKYKGERYNDTDVYKVIEGAAYSLVLYPDPELEQYLDSLISKIAAAQEEDGYLFTSRTIDPENPLYGTGAERWSNLPVSHELYNAGHLYEAAVAHFQATGKRSLLNVALKNADLVTDIFGMGKRQGFPGHQEIELGLVKLYRVTGEEKYLRMAKYFLDQRGPDVKLKLYPPDSRFAIYNDPTQIQAHLPTLDQDEAVGHAVRAMYQYSGMADVAALSGEFAYVNAIDRLWSNVVSKKLYLTGGVGARHDRERFGENYELPNLTAYNETCAAIGNVFWNLRMFLLHGDGKYLDVLERTLYNGVISGVSLAGDTFFYPNPLTSDGEFTFNKGSAVRKPWFGTACCPGNITRFLPSIPGYIYAHTEDTVYVNLFVESSTRIDIDQQSVRLDQQTRYPWDGEVNITVKPTNPCAFTLCIRSPGWTQNRPVPSDLYTYLHSNEEKTRILVNGNEVLPEISQGFIRLNRIWQPGDTVDIVMPMPVRRVISHKNVEANIGRVALERGPVVFCVEEIDNGQVLDLQLNDDAPISANFRSDLLSGIVILTGQAQADSDASHTREFVAVPYFSWANRGIGEMTVWIKRSIQGEEEDQ